MAQHETVVLLCLSINFASGSPGTRVVFTNLESNSYTIRVLAVAMETGEEEDFTRRINIPASSDDCVVNAINRGVSESETQGDVVIEFTVSGDYAFLDCRLDGVLLLSQLCKSVFNPRRACARVFTVVVLCVCLSVCPRN